MCSKLFCNLVEWAVAETSTLKHSPNTKKFVIKSSNQKEKPLILLPSDNPRLKALFLSNRQRYNRSLNLRKDYPNGRSKVPN